MRTREIPGVGEVSVLSLGGGGIGSVYGPVDRGEAVATVRAAVDAGISLLDLAPTYGPGETSPEAELVVAEAFRGAVPDDLAISTKVLVASTADAAAVRREIRTSVEGSARRLGRECIDLLLLHSYVSPNGSPRLPETLELGAVQSVVRSEFEQMREAGLIRAWGLTGAAFPEELCALLEQNPKPAAIQCVTNALDSVGDLWPSGGRGRPDNQRIRVTAADNGVAVMGIRALAAGALANGLDRDVAPQDPVATDSGRARAFRALARELAVAPAVLAHRYALSLPGVTTLVIGAKTRAELKQTLTAADAGPLSGNELREVEAAAAQYSGASG